ncbi:hypothetical protein BSIN_4830 [Burkholderia singularis]|uniref:Uncharacterized protein n=1 Tax=Burkholderia singularis TaxID=1503053 RepID=A0A238H9N9_9BURK|nr:hypothetical protein BSIN_4830 [Burkholderia singularis]
MCQPKKTEDPSRTLSHSAISRRAIHRSIKQINGDALSRLPAAKNLRASAMWN